MKFRTFICGSLLSSFLVTAASGTTFLPLSDRELLDRSDAVVIGTVGEVTYRTTATGSIVTDSQLRLEEVIKGDVVVSQTLTITEAGGSVGGRRMIVDGGAVYAPGQRVLVFLKRLPDGGWYTSSMSRGQFREGRNVRGEAIFLRDAHEGAAERPRRASEFVRYLRDAAGGRSSGASYLSTADALQPQADGGGAEYCYQASPPAGTRPIRWEGGESGSFTFAITGSQPGIDTSGLQADADAWTNVPTAGISLGISGGTPATDPNSPGPNTIFLNYTSVVAAGLCEARACTVWWINDAITHTYGGDTFYNITNVYIIFKSGFTQAQFNALAKHEFGHSIGLRHSNEGTPSSNDAIMVSHIDVGAITDLRDWDVDAVSTVYGTGAPCHSPEVVDLTGGGTVNSGSTATLMVTARGTPPFNYQWYAGESPDSSNPVGTNSPTFVTPPITAPSKFWVKIVNACDFVRSSTVTVSPIACDPPRMIDQPRSVTVNLNSVVTLEVFADGSSLSFTWYRGQRGDVSTPVGFSRVLTFTATQTASYWVRIIGACGSPLDSDAATVTVQDPSAPRITSFTATPATIALGEASTLAWTTQNATSVMIDHGVGAQPASGSVTVRPSATTTYVLAATGIGGTVRMAVTVVVTGPRVVVGRLSAGFVQRAGEGGGTDTFTLTNFGDVATTVTLVPSGGFFTVSPESFTIGPGATQTITITGLPQPADPYAGTVTATGVGVRANPIPVKMLSVNAPSGTVQPRFNTSRVEISSPAGQNVSGFVEFTNAGTATLYGIAVADVPWIVPQDGTITIPAGQTVQVTYMVDSAQRPDGDAPVGAAAGKITLVYIEGSTTGPSIAADGPPSTTISVTLVHVAKPTVGSGAPAPLAAGELALFVSGLGNKAKATGDLLLANRQTIPLSNVQLFVQGGGAQSLTTGLPQLVGNSSLSFPGLLKNVFASTVATGTAQVRGADAAKVTVAAIQTNTSSPVGTYSTALPVFRSDRSVAGSAAIILSGVQKEAAAQTDLFIQETSGTAGAFTIEFLDSAGRVVGSVASQAIAGFGLAELTDAVPANAISARIVNGTGSARLAAFGLVTNPTTGDGWLVTDPAVGSTTDDTFIIPIFVPDGGAETVLYATNRTSAPITMTIDARGGAGRRRSVRRSIAAPPFLEAGHAATSMIAPAETTATPISASTGYLRVSGPPAAISAVARSIRKNGTSAFGSGLPAVPVSAALASGEGKRFASVEDASSVSRAKKVPATFRTNLALVETNNEAATVRVTAQFTFSGGSLVSSSARVSKDYAVQPGQFLLVSDIAADVIGPNRGSLGDLRNVTLDVDVAEGQGRVIPFIQAIDNGSGDMLVRIE